MQLEEREFEGRHVTLIPMRCEHTESLMKAAADGELWNLWYTIVPKPEETHSYVLDTLKEREVGNALPFVVYHKPSQSIIGATGFCDMDWKHHRFELGFSWYAKRFQQTSVNTECKYLLLKYAFEELQAISVWFQTHWHNHTSRKAIERLGAKQDGVLRNHQKMPQGGYRDSVIYSIIESEWPTVKTHLEHKLGAHD